MLYISYVKTVLQLGLSRWLSGQESTCSAGDIGDVGLILGWEDPWRRKWDPCLVFLPGESHGQSRLVGCISWGRE